MTDCRFIQYLKIYNRFYATKHGYKKDIYKNIFLRTNHPTFLKFPTLK